MFIFFSLTLLDIVLDIFESGFYIEFYPKGYDSGPYHGCVGQGRSLRRSGSNRNFKHCKKIFQIVDNCHRCWSQECSKARQTLNRQSANTPSVSASIDKKSNKTKKDTHSPDKVDVNNTKKSKADSAITFIAKIPLATINLLSKTELISCLCCDKTLVENQLVDICYLELKVTRLSNDYVSDLESKVSHLNDDLESKEEEISLQKNEAVQMKVALADSFLKIQRASG